MTDSIPRIPSGRINALRAWLTANRLTPVSLARRARVRPETVTRLLQGKPLAQGSIRRMARLGLPECLLPRCKDAPEESAKSRESDENS